MENCQFEKTEQARAYSMFRPTPPTELVEIIIDYLSKTISHPFTKAVDVGCGTGQSTIVLAPYFQSVLGCDISKAQITEATLKRNLPNVEYKVASADSLPVPDHSVHLVTAATCFHWLDKDSFFKETKRVLAPGGILAVYSSCAIYPFTGDIETDDALRKLTNEILYEDMKMYRSPCVQQLFEEYKSISFPFDDVTKMRDICQTYIATARDAVGYIRSMSTFQNFREINPLRAEHMLEQYQKRIMKLLGNNSRPEVTPMAYQRNYFLIMCRKREEVTDSF